MLPNDSAHLHCSYNKNTDWTQNRTLVLAPMFLSLLFAVLRRIKVTFIDTIIRIEHQPLDLETGVALEVHIKR